MTRSRALPFTLRRQSDAFGREGLTSTTETVHGLISLDGEQLRIEWRVLRETARVGAEVRSDREVEPVQQAVVPIARLAGTAVRRPWWAIGRGPTLRLTAGDLEAFEALAGPTGLGLAHPGELVLRLRRGDYAAAREFGAELELALSELALRLATGAEGVPPSLTSPDR